MAPIQNLFHCPKQAGWGQTYGTSPSKLFIGANQRLTIYIMKYNPLPSSELYASRYNRWNEECRAHLFAVTEHAGVTQMLSQNSIPKICSRFEQQIWKKLAEFPVLHTNLSTRRTTYTIYFHDSPRYWIRAMDFIPYFWNERDGEKIQVHVKPLHLAMELDAAVAMSALNSSLFYWWYITLSDCRSLTLREIKNFPLGIDEMDEVMKQNLSVVANDLMMDLKHHASAKMLIIERQVVLSMTSFIRGTPNLS